MKLLNLNVGIKIDNTQEVISFIFEQQPDIITLQEAVRPLDDKAFSQYRSEENIRKALYEVYPYSFFGPFWVSDGIRKNGEFTRAFGGFVEQGTTVLSKFPIVKAENRHFYGSYSLAQDWTNWQQEDHARALEIVTINTGVGLLQVLNLHGIWTKDKKGDERTISECEYIVQAAKENKIPTIIAGDFNLLPTTSSIQILRNNFNDIISEYNIKSTRPDFKDSIEHGNDVVDYIFVDSSIKVKNFEVVNSKISDHLPLILDFEIESNK